ncbi:MAG: tetratricopeptide repeat protein, partial [Rickettsiales bacterium]|nr:tetratricopeptide repeat protein [Rickettsiales bacterium]
MFAYKYYYLGIFSLLVVGLVLSLAVIPSEKEVALMELKDRHFQKAFDKYLAMVQSGDLSPGSVIPLKRIYLQAGDVDAAILLMEKYLKKDPDYMDVRLELARLYRYAQRMDDYVRAM